MGRKEVVETYGLKVIETLMSAPRKKAGEQKLFVIIEHGIPLYEVNRWIEHNSVNSYLTGRAYAYHLLDYLRYIKAKKTHYKKVTNKKFFESYIKYLIYGDSTVISMNVKISVDAIKQRISVIKQFYQWLEDNGGIIIEDKTVSIFSKNSPNLKKGFLYGQIWSYKFTDDKLTKLRGINKQTHIKWYSQDEIRLILKALASARDKLIFRITIETGARIGEVLGLKLNQFVIDEGLLKIRREDNHENDAFAKTNDRDLPLSQQLTKDLCLYIQGERVTFDCNFSDFLFINHKGKTVGKAVSSKNYLKILKDAANKAGLDGKQIRTHSGRSTLAQILVEELHAGTVTETFILQQFGWSNIDTMKSYTRAHEDKKRISLGKDIIERRIGSNCIE